jgi:hypothetical protein
MASVGGRYEQLRHLPDISTIRDEYGHKIKTTSNTPTEDIDEPPENTVIAQRFL